MRASLYLFCLLLLPIVAFLPGCQSHDKNTESHFGPNPNDGIVGDDQNESM